MRVGDIVRYTHTGGEEFAPAIVLREWEDGSLQLYVFRFEGNVLVRAAHPTQIRTNDLETDLEDLTNMLAHRILILEKQIEDLKAGRVPETVEQPVKDEDSEPVLVGSTGKSKKSWPKS
jgi:hypothetical protein